MQGGMCAGGTGLSSRFHLFSVVTICSSPFLVLLPAGAPRQRACTLASPAVRLPWARLPPRRTSQRRPPQRPLQQHMRPLQ